jgi:hypothetical protein
MFYQNKHLPLFSFPSFILLFSFHKVCYRLFNFPNRPHLKRLKNLDYVHHIDWPSRICSFQVHLYRRKGNQDYCADSSCLVRNWIMLLLPTCHWPDPIQTAQIQRKEDRKIISHVPRKRQKKSKTNVCLM